MRRIAAECYLHATDVRKVPVTALAATLHKANLREVANQLSDLLWHSGIVLR